jgi:hypothetical protein
MSASYTIVKHLTSSGCTKIGSRGIVRNMWRVEGYCYGELFLLVPDLFNNNTIRASRKLQNGVVLSLKE